MVVEWQLLLLLHFLHGAHGCAALLGSSLRHVPGSVSTLTALKQKVKK